MKKNYCLSLLLLFLNFGLLSAQETNPKDSAASVNLYEISLEDLMNIVKNFLKHLLLLTPLPKTKLETEATGI
jgi:hypothetical protein